MVIYSPWIEIFIKQNLAGLVKAQIFSLEELNSFLTQYI